MITNPIFFWVEQTMECGIATLLSKLVGVTASRSRTESVKASGAQNFRNYFFQIIADP